MSTSTKQQIITSANARPSIIIDHSKLHPIYVALDAGLYTKAIKLCLQQPRNAMAQALLAHSYIKLGQRGACVRILCDLLPPFAELQLEEEAEQQQQRGRQQQLRLLLPNNDQQRRSTAEGTSVAPTRIPSGSTPTPSTPSKSKKGKKKGPTPPPPAAASPPASSGNHHSSAGPSSSSSLEASATYDDSCVDRLDAPPSLPKDWDRLPLHIPAPSDEPFVSTLSILIRNQLRLPLTAFQLLTWVANTAGTSPALPRILEDAFTAGFPVLVSPQYQHLTNSILTTMQGLAVQLTKQKKEGSVQYAAWAAQTAVWQSQLQPDNPLFPRLAESMALRSLERVDNNDNDPLMRTENFGLYLHTLERQEKREELLAALDQRLNAPDDNAGFLVCPPRLNLLDRKAQVLQELSDYAAARQVLETELLAQYPDDWSYWRRHLDCSVGEKGDTEGLAVTEAFVTTTLERLGAKVGSSNYPLRGPHLMKVEILAHQVRKEGGDAVDSLAHEIMRYGDRFAFHSSCALSDLRPYLELCEEKTASDPPLSYRTTLLAWLQRLGPEPSSNDAKIRRNELRAYTFSIQMTYMLVSKSMDLRKQWLPNWQNILNVWKDFQAFDGVTDDDQKENRPADELILLASQQFLSEEVADPSRLLTAAAVLEAGIAYSPYNPHLKISALFVYGELNAAARAWELFQTLHIKHIQYESCAYLILPILWSGGMYLEAVHVCKEIVRLQRAAAHDAGEYVGRAMENGALSKADEFLRFHKEKMNRSLTCLEAKGLILDGAPLLVQDDKQRALGAMQGIVGDSADVRRATEMAAHALDPFAAFSVFQLHGATTAQDFSDNRDFSILSHDLLVQHDFESPEQVVRRTQRRGYIHGLLIRCALLVELTKGPKKGKVAPPSDELQKRAKSLLEHVVKMQDVGGGDADLAAPMQDSFLSILTLQSRVLAVVSAGMEVESSSSLPPPEGDSLESRETVAYAILEQVREGLMAVHRGLLPWSSVSTACRMLPECLVPVLAVFRMCSNVLDLHGWGKRKCKTKKCAEVLASVALAYRHIVDDALQCLDSLTGTDAASSVDPPSSFPADVVNVPHYTDTCQMVVRAQQLTQSRVGRVLREIRTILAEFDVL